MKRKICVVVASRANYGRVKYVLKAIKESPELELQLIVGASSLLYRFGKVIDFMIRDGFRPLRSIYYVVEGETLSTQAKSTGLGVVELSTAFEDLKPDLVLTVADRFETMATAIAATYLNIPLAHLLGGEISGNIDEKVRHAITKLADIHFVSTKKAKERVIKMGEDKDYVFNYGCPSIDILVNTDLSLDNKALSKYGGVGRPIDWSRPYMVILQHPVTTTYGRGFDEITIILEVVRKFTAIQKVVLWPNVDAGTDDIAKGIRVFREKNYHENFHYFRNFAPDDYARILNNCVCAIGNSSSFLREGAFLGTPAVIIGNRQNGRERGDNVIFTGYNKKEIYGLIKKQVSAGKYPSNKLFGAGNAGYKIAKKLAQIQLRNVKKLTY